MLRSKVCLRCLPAPATVCEADRSIEFLGIDPSGRPSACRTGQSVRKDAPMQLHPRARRIGTTALRGSRECGHAASPGLVTVGARVPA